MRNVADEIYREKKHFTLKIFFLRQSFLLGDNVEKYFRACQATDYNMAHALCMLDTQD
jgi:hypothetical protein